MSTPTERIAEFLRQHEMRRGADPDELYVLAVDPHAAAAVLWASDLTAVLNEAGRYREYLLKLVADLRARESELVARRDERRRRGDRFAAASADAVARELDELADAIKAEARQGGEETRRPSSSPTSASPSRSRTSRSG